MGGEGEGRGGEGGEGEVPEAYSSKFLAKACGMDLPVREAI
jgi:hypothetical protein